MTKKPSSLYIIDLTSSIENVQENVDEFFQQQVLLQHHQFSGHGLLLPAVDIYETPTTYNIKIEMPAVDPDQIHISFIGNKLTVRGTRQRHPTEQKCSFHQMEILYGEFERNICLPEVIALDRIRAHYDRAFLYITLEKKSSKEPQTIILIKPVL